LLLFIPCLAALNFFYLKKASALPYFLYQKKIRGTNQKKNLKQG